MKNILLITLLSLLFIMGCTVQQEKVIIPELQQPPIQQETGSVTLEEKQALENRELDVTSEYETAVFAGGCFWCTEADFEKQQGVIKAISGYSQGTQTNPTYKNYGASGHTEVVEVHYDPSAVSYEELVNIHFRYHDPTDIEGQFVDRGAEYRPGIYYETKEQQEIAEQIKMQLDAMKIFDGPILTEIEELKSFYPAEEYHQDYYKKNPVQYNFYRSRSGRDKFLDSVWKDLVLSDKEMQKEEEPMAKKSSSKEFIKPTKEELKATLTPIQYKVTQQDGTEPPFDNEYWDNKEEGIYVDIVSGEPLFSSKDKYKSGTGWPSFTQPIEEDNIVKKRDFKLILPRTEIRSKQGDNHLGHVFKDGPEPTGLRYCMNSAALRFVPLKDLEKEGYGKYKKLFTSSK